MFAGVVMCERGCGHRPRSVLYYATKSAHEDISYFDILHQKPRYPLRSAAGISTLNKKIRLKLFVL